MEGGDAAGKVAKAMADDTGIFGMVDPETSSLGPFRSNIEADR